MLTVDYLRNVATHNLLSVDANHVGDCPCFNVTNANAAITTLPMLSSVVPHVDCALRAGASIGDYASNGLDSGYNFCGGGPCPPLPRFPGINPTFGAIQLLFPIGRSVYNGLQTSLRQRTQPIPRCQIAESASFVRFFALRFYRSGQRFHQLRSGQRTPPVRRPQWSGSQASTLLRRKYGSARIRNEFDLAFFKPAAYQRHLPTSGAPGGIFQTDITGDGTGDGSFGSNGGLGDLLPGTNVGGFGRSLT